MRKFVIAQMNTATNQEVKWWDNRREKWTTDRKKLTIFLDHGRAESVRRARRGYWRIFTRELDGNDGQVGVEHPVT